MNSLDFFKQPNDPNPSQKEVLRNISQNDMVLSVFKRFNEPLTASHVEIILQDYPILDKSIRRSMSVLVKRGILEITDKIAVSQYGGKEHFYKLK